MLAHVGALLQLLIMAGEVDTASSIREMYFHAKANLGPNAE